MAGTNVFSTVSTVSSSVGAGGGVDCALPPAALSATPVKTIPVMRMRQAADCIFVPVLRIESGHRTRRAALRVSLAHGNRHQEMIVRAIDRQRPGDSSLSDDRPAGIRCLGPFLRKSRKTFAPGAR